MSDERVLLVFHSGEGHTAEVTDRIAARLREQGAAVDVHDAADAPTPTGYDGAALGDPIHVGHHSKELRRYAQTHAQELSAMPSALFQVSMTSATHDAAHDQQAQTYVRELVEDTGWDPDIVGLFAGALMYTRYGWVTRQVMKRIAKREGQPTDTSHDYDYTDWAAVDAFADDVLALAAADGALPPQ